MNPILSYITMTAYKETALPHEKQNAWSTCVHIGDSDVCLIDK